MSPLNNSEIKGSDYYYDNNYTGEDIIHRQTDTYIHTQMKLMNIVQKKVKENYLKCMPIACYAAF